MIEVELKNAGSENYILKNINDVLPGEIILHPIYRQDGLVLINRFKTLTYDLIRKIKNHMSDNISVMVTPSTDNLIKLISNKEFKDSKYLAYLNEIINTFNKTISYPISIESLVYESNYLIAESKELLSDFALKEVDIYKLFYSIPFFVSFETNLESRRLQKRAKEIKTRLIDTILNNNNLYQLFLSIIKYKDILLLHSINTTSFSLMIGLTLELDDDDLINLGISALFSDVGFTRIPKKLFELYLREKKETVVTQQMEIFMKIAHEIPILRNEKIIYGILDRYEYINGTGLLKKKKGNEISLFGKILSISQAYDKMVGGYSFNDGIMPNEAINKLWNNRDIKFDSNILTIFIYRTSFYKLGQTITFDKDKKGKIIGFSDFLNAPNLPIVVNTDGKIINLYKRYRK